MIDHDQPDELVEALRRANPVQVIARPVDAARIDAILSDILTERPRRLRRRTVLVVLAVVLLAALLAAFVFVRRQHATATTSVVCYSAADLHAHAVIETMDVNASKTCASLWSRGVLGPGAVPNFDVCILPSGQTAAFPAPESGSVCPRLHLPQAVGGDKINRFVSAIDSKVTAACIGPTAAERIIDDELARRGLEGWSVVRDPGVFDAAHPCASIAVSLPNQSVTIVAEGNPRVPPPSGGP